MSLSKSKLLCFLSIFPRWVFYAILFVRRKRYIEIQVGFSYLHEQRVKPMQCENRYLRQRGWLAHDEVDEVRESCYTSTFPRTLTLCNGTKHQISLVETCYRIASFRDLSLLCGMWQAT
ncbi:hypothetical protein QBC32DRAFT_77777 [Pseudoneurospora amorphoporcata]|uniref:Uncharacterized protein n=1 Tax=Pseudoneurospora amorphoporcata TaxID=241081 RepID=A0AAN6NPB3_9PEZI|nr:hypothetical protein QBC32DRAFT_77777 [Pseudoneurospora amorphoporcata]